VAGFDFDDGQDGILALFSQGASHAVRAGIGMIQNVGEFTLRQVDQVTVMGRHQPVDLFEVIEAEPPESSEDKRATLALYTEGIKNYYAAEFTEAGRLFTECLACNPGDQSASTYLARCQNYKKEVPPNWTGVEFLGHK